LINIVDLLSHWSISVKLYVIMMTLPPTREIKPRLDRVRVAWGIPQGR